MPIKSRVRLVRSDTERSRAEFFEGVPVPARILVFAGSVLAYFAVTALFVRLLPEVVVHAPLGEDIPRIVAVAAAALLFASAERLLSRPAGVTQHPAEGAGRP